MEYIADSIDINSIVITKNRDNGSIRKMRVISKMFIYFTYILFH